jgi:CBS domain containing-hemolysin-like protein
LLPVLEDRHRLDTYIAASQVGITLSSIVLGIYGERQIAPRLEPWLASLSLGGDASILGHAAAAGIASTLVLLVLTTLQVVFGELVPKSLAIQYPERVALSTVLPMRWSADILLKPLIAILNGSGTLLLKLLRVSSSDGHTHVHSPEEIVILVKESHRAGLIDADERQFLQNVFRTSDTTAGEIAVPRTRMVSASADAEPASVLRLAAESAYTRIPIYEGNPDHIIGFVHLRDLFRQHHRGSDSELSSIVRPLPFVPETLPIGQVWERLDETNSYLAIVFDEYGGTSGLITREDIIEELFGELQDEFDDERAWITPVGEGRVVVRGDMSIVNLADLLEIQLPHETAHTVGGLVMDLLGRVPQVGDSVEFKGITFRVDAVAHKSATALCVTLPAASAQAESEEVD